jgi:hypothetical protein
MKLAIASALILGSLSTPALIAPAAAQTVPAGARLSKCGEHRRICVAARMAHFRAGWRVSSITYCGGQSTFCRTMAGYTYWYWKTPAIGAG